MTLLQRRHSPIKARLIRSKVEGYYRQAIEDSSIDVDSISHWPRSGDMPRTGLDEMMGCQTRDARIQLAATYWARCQFLLRDVVTDGEATS